MFGDPMKASTAGGNNHLPAEETVYAEPILVNHHQLPNTNTTSTMSSNSGGGGGNNLSSLPINNPLGTTLGPPPPPMNMMKAFPSSGLYSSSAVMHNNKFNTISNVNKRHGGGSRGSGRGNGGGGGGVMYMQTPVSLTDDILPNHYEKARLAAGPLGNNGGQGLFLGKF